MKNKPLINLKILNNRGEIVDRVRTRKTRRIYHYLQANKFSDCTFNLLVKYGKYKNNFGKIASFDNEGDYKTKKELIHALKAFTEQ
jgi:hypothetical protein